jgi:release factor glutamine methyltransferase
MSKVLKYIIEKTYRPILKWYLNSDRQYIYKDIKLTVKKGVFHPAFFFSTKFLLNELTHHDLDGKTFLELGAGSGLIAIYAAKQGALVTATDINESAITGLHENFKFNIHHPTSNILKSDLFDLILQQTFQYIIINPPYYPKQPKTDAERAWFCGAHFEYFEKLFSQIKNYMQSNSIVWISLSEDCDIKRIHYIASKNQLKMSVYKTKQIGWEKQFIFSVN